MQQHAAATTSNSRLQDALDHALQEMDAVRKAVSISSKASQECTPAAKVNAPAVQHPAVLEDHGLSAAMEDSALKSERIKELQRELAATLDERDELQAQLESLDRQQ